MIDSYINSGILLSIYYLLSFDWRVVDGHLQEETAVENLLLVKTVLEHPLVVGVIEEQEINLAQFCSNNNNFRCPDLKDIFIRYAGVVASLANGYSINYPTTSESNWRRSWANKVNLQLSQSKIAVLRKQTLERIYREFPELPLELSVMVELSLRKIANYVGQISYALVIGLDPYQLIMDKEDLISRLLESSKKF